MTTYMAICHNTKNNSQHMHTVNQNGPLAESGLCSVGVGEMWCWLDAMKLARKELRTLSKQRWIRKKSLYHEIEEQYIVKFNGVS